MPRKNKRGQGEGSIRERFKTDKNTGKKVSIGWEARYTAGVDNEGRQIQRSIYGKSSEEVKKQLRKVLTDIDNGIYVEPSKLTVSEWLDTWLWEYKKQSVKPLTFEGYEQLIRVYLKPGIGHIQLKELRPDQIQKMLNKIREDISPRAQGIIKALTKSLKKTHTPESEKAIKDKIEALKSQRVSLRTIEYVHKVLHGALEQALKNGLVIRNSSDAVNLPTKVKKKVSILTLDEQNKLIAAVRDHRLGLVITLTLFTGLRIGEVLALKWSDIDLKNGILNVNRLIQRVKTFSNEGPKTKVIEGTPKSEKGTRSIPLLEDLVKALKRHNKQQKVEIMRVGKELYQANDYVFCKETGEPLDTKNFDKIYHKLLKEAGIRKVTFHTLRHTFASRGLENGIDMKIMQELLGHAQFSLTADTYTHVLPEKKTEAIYKLNDICKAALK